jgi:hypothetical protein
MRSNTAATDTIDDAISLDLAPLTRARFTDVADVVATVRRWGLIVFPGFVGPDVLARMNAEFDDMIARRGQLGAPVDEYDNLINLRLDRDAHAVHFPAMLGFFGQDLMQEIATAYYAPESFKLNCETFASLIAETKGPQPKPPFALHFDRWPSLKFFLYLTDTDARNGAMRATPGSILQNQRMREQMATQVARLDQIPNIVPEFSGSVPICGPAGTMFVFDTDMSHGAGHVQPGFTRRTVRGHTMTLPLLRKMGYRV